MCGPICAIGIAGGLWLSRSIGINDLTLGIWIGALLLSLAIQLNKFLIKRNKAFSLSFWLIFILMWIMSILPLWGRLKTTEFFCGMPRLIFGALIGTFVLYSSDWLNNKIISRHDNKVYFYYQRTIIPIMALILVSVIVETIFC